MAGLRCLGCRTGGWRIGERSGPAVGDLADVVFATLPGADLRGAEVVVHGGSHDVVLLPGEAAVRVAREPGARAEVERVAELSRRLGALDLPFEVPQPLGPVVEHEGRVAVATTWIGGEPAPRGSGRPEDLAEVLEALAGVAPADLEDVLAPPHAYAGGLRWYELMTEEVVPRLPVRLQPEARRRVDAAEALQPVPPRLVHGDLAGDNLRWEDGRLVGVLDWDLASVWDPAVDAACLAWHGWDTVRAAVDAETYRRARIWAATFGIEQVAASIVRGDPPEDVERWVAWVVDRLDGEEAG